MRFLYEFYLLLTTFVATLYITYHYSFHYAMITTVSTTLVIYYIVGRNVEKYKKSSLLKIYYLVVFLITYTKVVIYKLLTILETPTIKLDRNRYIVSYFIGMHNYKMIVKKTRNLHTDILLIINEKGTDITMEVLSFLGPNNDFHGTPIVPKDLGYKKITLIKEDGSEVCFDENTTITM